MEQDKNAIQAIIETYATAGRNGEADKFQRLFWSEDPAFTIVENDRAELMGAKYIAWLTGLIKDGKLLPVQRFYNTQIFLVTPEIAYSISFRDESDPHDATKVLTSRVTFVYQKKQDEWRILHSHFSFMPK